MPRFFVENLNPEAPVIIGGDAGHIRRSLRMQPGEEITVCDTKGTDYLCEIVSFGEERVELAVKAASRTESEPSVSVTLFQCNPKGDKLESVIQKSVELGVCEIIPVLSARCISRPDAKAAHKKRARYQKIADSAAKQCGRGILPQVGEQLAFGQLCGRLAEFDRVLLFYEGGGAALRTLLRDTDRRIAVIIGPEGGFDLDEVEKLQAAGAVCCGLGRRILRTETAPLAALSGIMLLSGNLE